MGLLHTDEWVAKWIGYESLPDTNHQIHNFDPIFLEGSPMVWFPAEESHKAAPVEEVYFRRIVEITESKVIKRAIFRMLANNEAKLYINGQQAAHLGRWGALIFPRSFDITDKIQSGLNVFAIHAINHGNSPEWAGLAGKLYIEYKGEEEPQVYSIDQSWRATKAEQNGWKDLDYDETEWAHAGVCAHVGDNPWGTLDSQLVLPPPPYLRKDFSAQKGVKRAIVYATAFGIYELYLNGQRVGQDYFAPGWTDYNKRIYYQTYEVTNLVKQGKNCVGAILADGWYAGYLGYGKRREHYGNQPRFMMQLTIEYQDGTKKTIFTDETWKATYGPILEADFLMGETYDARLEMPNWAKVGFDDSNWQGVTVTEKVSSQIQAFPGVPVKKMQEIKPVRYTEPSPNVFVFDMGQNFAGWVRLKVSAQPGTKIVMRFAERLNPNGSIYTTNLRNARATDTYICSGGQEIWEPHFTYHGFQYVEVTGLTSLPSLETITGIVIHSDTPVVGSFECSNQMVNKLYQNIFWGQRSNFIEIPTDCPQRDERLGWTGDTQFFIRTATYNMDVSSFFTKWLVDLEDTQDHDGIFADVAPLKVAMWKGSSVYADAGIICPWTLYEVYNDRQLIEKYYPAMKKWVEYLKKDNTNYLRPANGYGDWLSMDADTPKDLINTAYFAYSSRLLSKMALAIGKNADSSKYEELFQQIKKAFNGAYVSEDGHVKGNTQTGYVLALWFDLLPPAKRSLASRYLVNDIKNRNYHISTGFVGLGYLLPTLTACGYTDVAYSLLTQDTFPSWGYCIEQGATTIWERWDGWTEASGFQDPGMNSFNHYALGSVGRWLYSTIGGIDVVSPGYKSILIHPQPGGDLTYAQTKFYSIHGLIKSYWRIEDNTFYLSVTIPANTFATVYIPAKEADDVTENKKCASQAEGVKFLRMDNGFAVYGVDSGTYDFSTRNFKGCF